MTNIVSIVQLNEIGYKADIDDVVMCILEPGRCLMAKVTWVVPLVCLVACDDRRLGDGMRASIM
jgi:hypothetical protein